MLAVIIPGSVKTIYDSAFLNCSNLETIEILNGVTKIGESAFQSTACKSIVIPSSVVSIGGVAFTSAYLKTVNVLATTPPHLEITSMSTADAPVYNTFGNRELEEFVVEQIIVPKGCGNAYKVAEGWVTYADLIVEES